MLLGSPKLAEESTPLQMALHNFIPGMMSNVKLMRE